MTKKLLLIDLENKHKVDLSPWMKASGLSFCGANQNPPKASKKPATARFKRVDFLKISGAGKNALDFHIAFELGRTFETAPDTQCFVLSGDKGFDPLLNHLNNSGMSCRRVESIDELVPASVAPVVAPAPDVVVCPFCKKASTVEHHGGHWCSNCGRFATLQIQSSCRPTRRATESQSGTGMKTMPSTRCGWCNQNTDMTGGIYDDGEWMCGGCIARYAKF